MHKSTWLLAALITTLAALPPARAAEGDGLQPSAEAFPSSRWQGRLALGTAPAWRPTWLQGGGADLRPKSLSLMGDYYFSSGVGGFRATSGLIVGRSTLWAPVPSSGLGRLAFSIDRHLFGATPAADAPVDTLPYLGVGYTGLSAQRAWSFSADVGLVAQSPSQAVNLGRVFSGAQGLDDQVRDLRLSPVLQLGVSYSF